MNVIKTAIPEVVIIEPKVFSDLRGYFFESFNQTNFEAAVGCRVNFVQENESYSKQGVLRGLHYQIIKPQGKLVRVVSGEVFDVALDIRRNSPTFGRWIGEFLSAQNKKQLWIPEGFAHGFLVLSESATFQYKVTDFRYPEYERSIRFDDSELSINWPSIPHQFPIMLAPLVSEKDRNGSFFKDAELF